MTWSANENLNPGPDWAPLSCSQQRLWLFTRLSAQSTAYNLGAMLWLEGELNPEALEQTINYVIARQDIVRVQFAERDGQGWQRIAPHEDRVLQCEDVSNRADPVAAAYALGHEFNATPFDLETDSLLRYRLVKLNEQRHVLLISLHHIVGDAWSLGVFMQEFLYAYSALREGLEPKLPSLETRYLDWVKTEVQWLASENAKSQLEYWVETLEHEGEPLALPRLSPQSGVSNAARYRDFSLSIEQTQRLKKFSRTQGVSRFTVLLSVLQYLLFRISGQSLVRVGVPSANRNSSNQLLMGFFVNNLVVQGEVLPAQSVSDWIAHIHHALSNAKKHRDIPFEKIVDELSDSRRAGSHPLFQVAFNYRQQGKGLSLNLGNLLVRVEDLPVTETPFDLVLDAWPDEHGGLTLRLVYGEGIFDDAFAERMVAGFEQVLDQWLQAPALPLTESAALVPGDVALLQEWGQGEGEWQATSFVSLFSQQAAKRGDAIALVHGGTRVSFAELDARSNQLARYLMGQGVKADQVVGVSFERGVTMVEAFIAVMKAGGAFLPLDPGYPADRLRYMLEDSGASLLLTSSDLIDTLPSVEAVNPIAVDELSLDDFAYGILNEEPHPDQLAYVIYTSGSTGKPKGVSLTHAGLSMHVQTIGERYGMTPDDVELQFASISFDGAVERWTVPLAFGSRVVIRDQQLWSAQQTCDALQKEGVTIACIPPSYMGPLLDWIEQEKPPLNVRSWTLGGEAFTRETFERMQQVLKPQRILNGYGPTETVVTPMLWAAYEGDTLSSAYAPIGHAVGPRKLYVLDQDLNRVPVGVAGELYIGNEVGLARGYHQRPDLTAERFLPDPFGEPGERMYRTGDLVKYRDDGVMEYLGRVDQQVKIRGFRIELGEIESQLLGHEQIREAVVVAQPSPTGDRLVGYIVMRNAAHSVPGEHEPQTILAALSESLPDYMVPSQLITLEAMPLTPAGKVDRKALPVAQWHTASEGAPPQTDNEKVLADIWQSLLGRKGVSRDDNFFALGGDSILALQVVSRARQQGLALTPKDLFEHPRLHDLAACAVNAEASIISQQPLQGELGLLPIQQHFFSLRPPSPSHWNQHLWLALDAPMDRQALNVTLQALYRQHDALRLQFTYEANGWRQTCLSADRPCDELLWWCQAADEAAVETLCEQTQQSLNIETGELFRVLYVQTPQQPDRMLLVIHHLAVDGVSWRILLDDLLNAYGQALTGAAITLPERSHNLSDWHQALEQWLQSKGEARLPFWQGQQPEKIDSALPTFAEKESVALSLGKDDTRRLLQDAPVKLGVSVPALLLTALTRTLKPSAMGASLAVRSAPEVGSESPSQDNQLVINLEGHGRETRLAPGLDLSRTLGWFTSLFPLRLPFDGDPRRNLFAVSQQLANTEADGGVGYGALRYLADSPLNDSTDAPVTFNYLGQYHNDALIQGFTPLSGGGKAQAEDNPMAAPLAINGQVVAGKLGLVWDFARSHYPRQQVQHLCSRYRQELLVLLDLADSPQEARADPALVTVLNSSADTPVLWCPHPVTGRTTGYQALAASLEGQWQVRGLQSRSFLEPGWFDPSLSEMVERYYRTVRQAQPEGPYYLLGWSMGGAMSMELAHRLEQAGEEVAFVGLLDTYVPGHEVPEDQWSSPEAQQTLRAHLGMLLTCAPATALDDCMARLRDSKPAQWPQNFTQWLATQSIEAAVADSAAQLLHAWAVEQHLRDLCWGYQLPALHTPVHSWWASEPAGRAQALQRGLALCAELAHTETVSADHLTIVREPSLLQGLSVLLKCCKGGNALMDIPD
ncbi:non-ribosomal peptide synthetase [uncultured Alcanivorax sp.]|uniref:non-ribosomal peptide synthetase n=2 Tax=Alcanivorax TaxID=59753 RepID=UPI00258C1423|nr:non-ribosomal peptide synthetase [uncultured Alcanivorax sp.]